MTPHPQLDIALCLSGGGYRAMLFHLGAIYRLLQAGYLERLKVVSGVSGGSMTAAVLANAWNELKAGKNLEEKQLLVDKFVAYPLRDLASNTIDYPAVSLAGLRKLPFSKALFNLQAKLATRDLGIPLNPLLSPSDLIANVLDARIFNGKLLQHLPEEPEFIFNATSLQTGKRFIFSRHLLGDEGIGFIHKPQGTRVADAVAASAGFPPFLSPVALKLGDEVFGSDLGLNLTSAYRNNVYLADGGLYDNLGLDGALGPGCRRPSTLLISDGGARMQPQVNPGKSWVMQARRIIDLLDEQVRTLRQQQLNQMRGNGARIAYWWIGARIEELRTSPLECPPERTSALAAIPTRLKKLTPEIQNRLINWGYAVCDASLRKYIDRNLPFGGFLYPGGV